MSLAIGQGRREVFTILNSKERNHDPASQLLHLKQQHLLLRVVVLLPSKNREAPWLAEEESFVKRLIALHRDETAVAIGPPGHRETKLLA